MVPCIECLYAMLQEAEIEEDVEATRVLDWDKGAADAAYRAKVEEAEARQRALLEQQAAEVCAWSLHAAYWGFETLPRAF